MKWPTMTPKGNLGNGEDSWGFLNARAFSLYIHKPRGRQHPRSGGCRSLSCAYTPVGQLMGLGICPQPRGTHDPVPPRVSTTRGFPHPSQLASLPWNGTQVNTGWMARTRQNIFHHSFPERRPTKQMRPAGEAGQAPCSAEHTPHTPHDYRSRCPDRARCCLHVRAPAPILLLKAWPASDGMRGRGLREAIRWWRWSPPELS